MPTNVKMYWWKHPDSRDGNFGDELTPEIISTLWPIKCAWAPISECDLIGAGSILEKVTRENKPGHRIAVWGSGFMHARRRPYVNKDLVFHAVRGKISRRRLLLQAPFVGIGDPGMLSSLVYSRSSVIKYKIGLVVHYADMSLPEIREILKNPLIKLINPLQRPSIVVDEITSCEMVLSSSLHGLIVADSFGVPNYWIQLSDNVIGDGYKFEDYFSSIGKKVRQAKVDDLLKNKDLQYLLDGYTPIKDISKIQSKLIRAFPFS